MKNVKVLLLINSIFVLSLSLIAQEIVVTSPQLKNIILEEYTGINCPYCPYGHQEAEAIYAANPDRVAVINIHTGYYAIPDDGQPDFRTDFGSALASEASVSGYPSASVNRHMFSGLNSGGTAMGRDLWVDAAALIKVQPSYVNIGFRTDYNESTRELTVDVELYYVEEAPFMVESNFINLVLTENLVYGYQANGSSNYEHNHILRHMITGQWGDEVTSLEAGTLVERTYTYNVPEEWNAENCDITAFVAEEHSEVLTGGVAPMIGALFAGETELDYGRLNMNEFISTAEAGNTTNLNGSFLVGDTLDANYSLNLTSNQPDDWNVTYSIDGAEYSGNTEIQLSASTNYPISFNITPGATNGVGHYVLEISSDRFPDAETKTTEFYVIKGVSDLVVNGSGTFTGINSATYANEYLDALAAAGSQYAGAISAMAMEEGFTKGILNDVQNIFMNISYTHPSLSENQIDALENFIDNGGNLLIAGQDIGWDAMAIGGYSGLPMKLFYANYLQATYSNSGIADDNEVFPIEGEKLFGGLNAGNLVSLYGNALSADKIYPRADAEAVLSYEQERGPVAAIRSTKGDAKIVYLAFGLEQLVSNELRDSLMSRTHQWFTGQLEIGVEDVIMETQLNVYPNPVDNVLSIEHEALTNQMVKLSLIGIDGKIIYQDELLWDAVYTISLEGLNSGLYFVKLNSDTANYIRKFIKK